MSTPSDPTDHYAALGVPRTASTQEIKARYYELCKRLHPDARVPGEPDKWSRKGVIWDARPTTPTTCTFHASVFRACAYILDMLSNALGAKPLCTLRCRACTILQFCHWSN